MRKNDWLYWGLGLSGFLALVSYKPAKPVPTPKPPEKGETKSVEYQTDNGRILVQLIQGSDWITPQLASENVEKFRTMLAHWQDLVDEAVLDYRVPESWIWGIMWAESKGDPKAKSEAGAMGLMQVMPYHFKPGEEPYEPRTNIRAGARYLQSIRGQVGDDLVRGASMYNAGGPWTNESWLQAKRNPKYTTKWGFPAQKGYIDSVIAGNNTFSALGPQG